MPISTPVPTEAEHLFLVESPEARVNRHAKRLGKLAVSPGMVKRGRRRPNLEGMLLFPVSRNLLEGIQQQANGMPFFDQFSKSYRVAPTKEDIGYYARSQPVPKEPKDEYGNLVPWKDALRTYQRQGIRTGDSLQRASYQRFNLARQRGSSVRTTLDLIKAGHELDHSSAMYATDAVADFGFCLMDEEQEPLLDSLGAQDIGWQIAAIGVRAAEDIEFREDFSLLTSNVPLLEATRQDQLNRYNYWKQLFEATQEHLGDRLTPEDRAPIELIDVQLAYQQSLRDSLAS